MGFIKRLLLAWKIKRLYRKAMKEKDPILSLGYSLKVIEELQKAKEKGYLKG